MIDGDTIVARLDLGFRLTTEQVLRLSGIDTPELHSKDPDERALAVAARTWTEGWIAEHAGAQTWPLLVSTAKGDSFGRWIAKVYLLDPAEPSLNERLLANGFAKPYTR